MRSIAALLAFAASALAFQVTQPTNATGWSTAGSNVVAWTSVSTDAANFTIVLVNQVRPPAVRHPQAPISQKDRQNVFPPTTQILAALVDSSLGNTTVNPPSGGWKSGAGFQVNLVKDDTDLNTILAQSPQFTIAAASTTQSATTSAIATSGTGTL